MSGEHVFDYDVSYINHLTNNEEYFTFTLDVHICLQNELVVASYAFEKHNKVELFTTEIDTFSFQFSPVVH